MCVLKSNELLFLPRFTFLGGCFLQQGSSSSWFIRVGGLVANLPAVSSMLIYIFLCMSAVFRRMAIGVGLCTISPNGFKSVTDKF